MSRINQVYFRQRYEAAKEWKEIFEVIKEGVEAVTGYSRSGLMLGFTDLGIMQNGFIGAFYPVGSNLIVFNKSPLKMVEGLKPELLKPYIFHVLMHEYLHTLGVLNENHTHLMTYKVNERLFGEEHAVTRMSFDFERLFPQVMLPGMGWRPQQQMQIELVDVERTSYIG